MVSFITSNNDFNLESHRKVGRQQTALCLLLNARLSHHYFSIHNN